MAKTGAFRAAVISGLKKKLRRTTRRIGVDLVRWRPQSSSEAAIAKMLTHHRIDTVMDIGANEGQYARLLREAGYTGRIISFEPLTRAHEQLLRASACDPLWTVAPRMAIGNREGVVR